MADFPGAIFAPRTTENLSGVVYDPTKTKEVFAEDYNKPAAEVAAIETELGTNPKGTFANVKARMAAVENQQPPLAKASGGSRLYGIPDTPLIAVTTDGWLAGACAYSLFRTLKSITITSLIFEVTTTPASNSNARVGIYLADSDMQPTGAPLYDSCDIAVASGFTGVKTVSGLSIVLPPGIYLVARNASVQFTCRSFTMGAFDILPAMGTTPFVYKYNVAQGYGAFPTPGTLWTSPTASSGTMLSKVLFSWT